ncbi:MAG: transglutaminase-like domain-containing protein [Bacteroidales bacterium]|nr:transglutaminase domain-containing protein [Muribaculaceae bacterium]MDY6293136.1 transglutaminase-like domain-containing protein [Bacteroidales bacterium]
MKINRKLMVSALMAIAMTAVAQTNWVSKVEDMMDRGEFLKAEQFMKSLPKGVRVSEEVRIDSLNTIMGRIRKDFTMTPEEGLKQIKAKMPNVTQEQIAKWKRDSKIEYMVIDGKEWWFRKSVRNLWLLADELKEDHDAEKWDTYNTRRRYYLEAMQSPADANGLRDWRHIVVRFYLDVNADAIPAGETLRVWMPFPYQNLRQRNIKLESSNYPVTYSEGSKHHTVYMEAKTEKGKPTHFEYTFSYDVAERHIAQDDLLAMLEPYDKNSAEYKEFTGNYPPHIVITDDTRALAREIVEGETNPVLQASKIFNWISSRYPWAGAREYSTIKNMPEYVMANGHGDCGQVALMYITLVRSLGIPARWESGWMLHPDEINWHDWAETYFEGIGWVPTDQSFGRSAVGTPMNNYYATGIDVYRMASNEAIGDKLSPEKKFIRSETVDFQPGEVEWRKGNLYYDTWKSHLEVKSITKIK